MKLPEGEIPTILDFLNRTQPKREIKIKTLSTLDNSHINLHLSSYSCCDVNVEAIRSQILKSIHCTEYIPVHKIPSKDKFMQLKFS